MWDDAQYLYSQPGIVYDDDHSMLKTSKSLTDKPVWMNKSEADQVLGQEKITRENDPYRGIWVEPDIRQDELYYEGQRLLEASELDYASAVSKLEYSLTRFDLKDDWYLIAVEKRLIVPGHILRTNYLHLFQAGKATFLRQQNPAKVIPNQNGSYWIASYLEFPMANTLQVSRLDSEGHLDSLKEKWNELSVSMIGLGSPSPDFGEPGFPNPQTIDGNIYVVLSGYPIDRNRGLNEPGLYMVNPELELTKVTATPISVDSRCGPANQLYLSSDMQLYMVGKEMNKISNLTTQQAALWYDHELVKAE